ncbi:MAG TPA: pyridoxal-dependent decarboxylase [Acidimicrobiales bacterium]|nr:pyridoxal-dependent decarboxylase [Acidimicrobiales bacterium]
MTHPMFAPDPAMTELVLDYCREKLAEDPIALDHSGDKAMLDTVLGGCIGDGPQAPEKVLRLFDEHMLPGVISTDSPRFLAFIPTAPTTASCLFDMVVSALSLQGSSWLEAAGVIAAENQVIRVLADLAGLPPSAGGVFLSGGSAGNLSALAVARDTARRRLGTGRRLRMAVCESAHSSIAKALHLLDVGTLEVAPVDHRMTGAALRAALAADDEPETVVGAVATAGTTNAGIVDDIAGVAAVTAERGLWLHVDAAYGGAALLSSRARHLLAGIEHADSFIVDPHKWLFSPFDCAALVYRHPAQAKAVHTQDAAYLDAVHRGDDQGDTPTEWNPSDYAYHLTRRARGLATWFSLSVNGLDAYREAVDAAITQARSAAALIRRHRQLELVRHPQLSIVLFRRHGWEVADYYDWSARLLRDQIGFVTPTTWEGRPAARLAFLHPSTTDEIVEEILATTR